jgi:hypothetical protein
MATTIIRDTLTQVENTGVPGTPTRRDTVASATGSNDNGNDQATQTKRKYKRTFMLHSVTDMTALGRFISTDWRYAALKAASRGHTKILLRQTGTREVREFDGNRIAIDPKEITRGGRTITYTHRPQVKFNKKYMYSGAIDETAPVKTNPVAIPDNTPA